MYLIFFSLSFVNSTFQKPFWRFFPCILSFHIFVICQVENEQQPPNFDMDFPPGFEPKMQTPDISPCSPTVSQVSSSSEFERKGSIGSQQTLLSDGLTEVQSILEKELYVVTKSSLFEYFEDVLKEELTNLIYSAMEETKNKVENLFFFLRIML